MAILIEDATYGSKRGVNVVSDTPSFNFTVSVRREYDRITKDFRPTVINWPGCGDRSVEYAEEFASALRIAVLVAKRLDEGFSFESIQSEVRFNGK